MESAPTTLDATHSQHVAVGMVNDIVVAPSTLTVMPASADLAVAQIKSPKRSILTDGTNVTGQTARVRIANWGNAPANGTLAVNLYLSSDKVLDGTDVLAGVVTARPVHLKPGASAVFSARLLPTPTLRPGEYYLFAVTTTGGRIVRKNPANGVGLGRNRVSVARARFPIHHRPHFFNQCFDGTPVDDSGDNGTVDVLVEVPTPSDLPPSPPPSVPATGSNDNAGDRSNDRSRR